MILRIATASLTLVALSQPALADKFYLGAEAESKKTVGNAAGDDFVEGVLLKEDKSTYTIRVLGGEITLDKASVRKVEQDGLTLAMLEGKEKVSASRLAEANSNRRQILTAEASASRTARVAAATARRDRPSLEIDIDLQGILGQPSTGGRTIKRFDPVINRTNMGGLAAIVDDYIQDRLDQRTRPTRDLRVQINLGEDWTPHVFNAFDANLTQDDLDAIRDGIYAYLKQVVQLAAHQNPNNGKMNLPYGRRR